MLAVKNKIKTAEIYLRGKKRVIPVVCEKTEDGEEQQKKNINHPWVSDKTYNIPK